MGEQNDRRRGGLALEIVGEPLELILAEAALPNSDDVANDRRADEARTAGHEDAFGHYRLS